MRRHTSKTAQTIVNAYLTGLLAFLIALSLSFIYLLWRAHGLWWVCLAAAVHLSVIDGVLWHSWRKLRNILFLPPE